MSDSLADTVADNIRAHARRAGLKQQGLAERLGFSSASVAQRWRGDVAWKLNELPAVADALHVGLPDLFGAVAPEPTPPPAPDLSGIESRLTALEEVLRKTSAATLGAIEAAHEEASSAVGSGGVGLAPVALAQKQAGAALETSTTSLAAIEKAQQQLLRALEASTASLADARTALEASAAALAPIEKANEDAGNALQATSAALAPLEEQGEVGATAAVAALERVHAEASRLSAVDEALQSLRAEVRLLS